MDWKDLAITAVYNGGGDSEDSIWERVDDVDVGFIGAFLTAHLSLEKYIDDYLALRYPTLSWRDAKLTFSQKIALIQKEPATAPYDEIYLRMKDFNGIRNKISHNLNYRINEKDRAKFLDFYKKINSNKKDVIDSSSSVELIGFFVMITKAYLASRISYYHHSTVK